MKFEKAYLEVITLNVSDIVITSDTPVTCEGDMGGCAFL